MKKRDIYKGVEHPGNISLSPKPLKMSPGLSPWGKWCRYPKNRPWTEEEQAALAADFSRRKKWLGDIQGQIDYRMSSRIGRRRRAKSHAEIAAETDVQVRASLFLNEEEQKQNARFLRENNRVREIVTDEDAADAQIEQQNSPLSSADQLEAAIDNATGIIALAWHGDIVGDRLIEAYRTLDLLPLSTLPASFKNSMPTVIRDEVDRQGEQDQREKHDRERNHVRLSASSHAILRMEEAFLWPIRLLKKEKFRRIVFLWAQWRAPRKNLRVMCRLHQIDYSTFMRRREIAVLAIAYELNKARVPVVISERVSSRARRRKKLRNTTASTRKKSQARAIIRGEVIDFS